MTAPLQTAEFIAETIMKAVPYLLPDTSTRGISSIAYYGLVGSGKLVAGEVNADNIIFISDIWLTLAPPIIHQCGKRLLSRLPVVQTRLILSIRRQITAIMPNAQLAWSPEGDRIYCGTSSADLDHHPSHIWLA